MKKLLFIFPALIVCIFSCKPSLFTPKSSENPWQDDYRSISGMENYKLWGPYNVHDPSCKKIGDYFYMYSTDAIFDENRKEAKEKGVPLGFVQVRKSKDLVNWEFVGWAFPEIPEEAAQWVRTNSGGRGATNIWAPYIMPYKDIYRLYFCVSAFGRKTSYIGLAESDSPEGPWVQKGCVVKTNNESAMNAIDPSVVVDAETGKWWMHYGSYFGGLFCVELDEATGLTKNENDLGHLVARRANYRKDNLEAPEIIYNPDLKQYYLFVSYDPLMTTYNVRVGRSDKPEGPFTDFSGQDLRDTINDFPILTASYKFEHHPGWAGVAHCAVLKDNENYYMLHQARLSPDNHQMVLHVRKMFFDADGWPVVSPERYAATPCHKFTEEDLIGDWEIVRVKEPLHERNLEAGQILWGEGELREEEWNRSFNITLSEDGVAGVSDNWCFLTEKQSLNLTIDKEELTDLRIFAGQDWENEKETILFTGLDGRGRSVWGKRVK